MKAVILSAGRGTRLRPLTDMLPKALISIEGKTLLEYSLAALLSAGITETIIVIGYLGDLIKKIVGNSFFGMAIKYVLNEDYLTTGTMYSFYKTKDLVGDDILLLEADLLYDPAIIKSCISSKCKDLIVVSRLSGTGDEVLVVTDDTSTVSAIGKKIDKKNILGEFTGISKLSRGYVEEFFTFVSKSYFAKNILGGYYEDYFVAFGNECSRPMNYFLIDNSIWTEIDDKVGLERAKNKIFPNLKNVFMNEKH